MNSIIAAENMSTSQKNELMTRYANLDNNNATNIIDETMNETVSISSSSLSHLKFHHGHPSVRKGALSAEDLLFSYGQRIHHSQYVQGQSSLMNSVQVSASASAIDSASVQDTVRSLAEFPGFV